jgi:hypothetical protein
MAITKTPNVHPADGHACWDYRYDGRPDDVHATETCATTPGACDPAVCKTGGLLLTGSASGPVTLSDGTVYDLSAEVIEHAYGHAGPLKHHVEIQIAKQGTLRVPQFPGDMVGVAFSHTCTDDCGAEKVG